MRSPPAYRPHNDPTKPGSPATLEIRFGDGDRYGVVAINTRFDEVSWIVLDYLSVDPSTDLPEIIRQGETQDEVMSGLT